MPAPCLARVAGTIVLSTGIAAVSMAQSPPGASFSIAPLVQFDSDLDSGGDAAYAAILTSLGTSWRIDERSSLGVRLRLDYEDWDFDKPLGFGGEQPWDRLYRAGISVPYGFTTESGWRLGLNPTIESSGESGANFSETLEYGATASVSRAVRPDLTLGLGVGVFERIEETSAFPFLIIDWRINDRLRLTNPFPAGPAGPAGLELSYTLDSGWTAGAGAAYRSYRFRLDSDGPFPDGVGEHRFIPVFVQVGRDLTENLRINLYAGAAMETRLRVEDEKGRRLYEEDQDPAAMLGVSLIGRF
ncbi:DUF6268 family outer membrane beta-barrel protein [Thiocapsa marina]|uniref:DUF6268 domain-containing protein n=1 Tax=Thiocapsa marina 5811 TaxID=768671 RepID=F9U8T2_9GAMM|nr:DUF6268 family outer membrane beta-barrel protein [Thiocapsa marina]EGV19190.1 hypothetical protein ThimaDRAFT_1334 [Thiocapsa marina 5811]